MHDEHYFVRCVLVLPILGAPDDAFGFGVWSSLSRKNFEVYVDTFDSGEQDTLGPWFGWFSNRLRGYPDTANLKCQVHPRGGRRRPDRARADRSPARARSPQRHHVRRLLDIYAVHGHDLRAALSDA